MLYASSPEELVGKVEALAHFLATDLLPLWRPELPAIIFPDSDLF